MIKNKLNIELLQEIESYTNYKLTYKYYDNFDNLIGQSKNKKELLQIISNGIDDSYYIRLSYIGKMNISIDKIVLETSIIETIKTMYDLINDIKGVI